MAVLALLASAGFAYGETATPVAPSLTLDRQALRLDDAAAPAPLLTQGLTQIGAQSYLDKAGITIGGYFDSGYIYNHRNHEHYNNTPKIVGGGFNSESHNNYTIDAIDLQIARAVDASKGNWDVGGLVEVMYGADAAAIHSNGLEYGNPVPYYQNSDPGSHGFGDRYHPQDQFDIPQAYLDIVTPIKGLKVRVGKFDTLLGYESINPNNSPFYSHSFIFNVEPLTHTGVVAFYQINDQLSVAAGVTRGWDQSLKDNNGSPDGIFQVTYKINKQWTVSLQGTIGPEDTQDTAHWRFAPDLTTTYAVNDKLSIGAEAIYFWDGGWNNGPGNTNDTVPVDQIDGGMGNPPIGSYGDVWGGALYAAYKVDDHFTINFRAEKVHVYSIAAGGLYSSLTSGGYPAQNFYEATLGTTITPMPKDRYLSGIKIRPEVRYDWNANHADVFPAGKNNSFTDQLTFGADLIINF